ncbi:broad-complex core protein isoforms 1/2/3/4/5 [Folsomia candida]|uniref:Protein bric-a-brac 1 n=1 Tax=Folsomia candida TaxID=158441 RepID=A0A226F370_FOLCA|nr:broad-complex core protein isoforms 1/2/3/4/5 [Folsomia candida]OXA63621.1 Protein bric-a-brac 1 [Folsomia candida]
MNMNTGPPPFSSTQQQQTSQPVQQQTTTTAPPLPTPPEATQQFCLRWNSYPVTVATQLAELRAQEDFVDVTLACDGRQLKAHKLVLSACSPYFMQLFKSTPCQHPVIFLHEVGFRQLVALLEFMYAGEVNVSQVELPALLRTAEALQVRGLADTTANNNSNNNNTTNNSNNTNCPPPQQQHQQQQPKPNFSPQYGQMLGHQQQLQHPVMNNTLPIPPAQLPLDQSNSSSGGCGVGGSGMQMSIPSGDMPSNNNNNNNILASQQPTVMGSLPIVPSSMTNTATTSNHNNNNMSNIAHSMINSKLEANSSNVGGNKNNDVGEEDDDDDANDFEMLEALGQSKGENYIHDGTGDMSGDLEDTGQIFPDDPLAIGFDVGDEDGDGGNGDENQSEEESSEVSDDDDGECKEFAYQSDASYSQEGMSEGDGIPNPNGENAPGPSGLHPGLEPGAIVPGSKADDCSGGTSTSARNRLSRSLWPPGIPYHGPQQCPYCTRVLSNVGNWRKHVLTMHFAREKIFKCRHCTSSFRTAEYLQKHYVRVHNYPQKMTRRKYVEPT